MLENIFFEITLLIIGISSTALIAFLFKYVWKSKSDEIFEDNMKQTADEIFKQLADIDEIKQYIYDTLEYHGAKYVESECSKAYTLPEFIVDDIREMEADIVKKSRSLAKFLRTFPYVTYEQQNAVLNYAITSCSFLNNGMFNNPVIMNNNILHFHMYFAKQTTLSFGKLTEKMFLDKWNIEFEKFGGINLIIKPKLEMGRYIDPYDD